MLNTILQMWGGGFYLLNKIGLSRKERASSPGWERTWGAWSWFVYLIGLPAWVWILIQQENWIVASVEAGGAPAMLLGLILALRGERKRPRWLTVLDIVCGMIAVTAGISYSVHMIGGIERGTQVLELGVAIGFLGGTYLLATKHHVGYYLFMLMNGSNAILQGVEGKYFLVAQQIASIAFVIDAYRINRGRRRSARAKTIPAPAA